jgi:SWI/SNF-related matrix-associated actin-dependent regulator of chromatin subfamily A-like protein 1
MNRLYPFQRQGVDWLKSKSKALLADACGLGKTVQAIVAIKELGEISALVICPATVKYNWEREFKIWHPDLSVWVVNGSEKIANSNVVIINYDLIYRKSIMPQLLKRKYNVLICDEGHYLKNARAKRTKAVYSKNGLADSARRVWLLTGTPILNRPVELYSTLRKLTPDKLGKYADYITYTKQFCGAFESRWGWDTRGASNLEELSGLLSGFMLRREKKDVLKQLPDKTLQKIVFPITDKTTKEVVDREKKAHETKETVLGDYSKIRAELGVKKLPLILEHIETLLEEKEKLVVFAHHRAVLEAIRDKFAKEAGAVLLYGGLTARQKQDIINKFVEDKSCRLFIGQIDAAGTGVDGLQKVCDTIVFAETSWVPGQINQAIDRCHRIGQDNKVLIQFLVVKGSVDDDILESVFRKSKTIKKLITGVKTETKGESIMHTIEQNLERIANALEKMALTVPPEEQAIAQPQQPEAAVEFSDKPKKAKATATTPSAPKAVDGPQTAKELLAYCNSQVLPLADKKKGKEIVMAVMRRVKDELGSDTLQGLPNNAEVLAQAKVIFDEEYQKGIE